MKLQPDKSDVQSISGYGPGWLAVNGERVVHSVVVSASGGRFDWLCQRFADLTPAHFAKLLPQNGPLPELVIFGSGRVLRFVPPAWLAPLMQQRVGLETMDTLAACRTYNILAGEGRQVVLAALVEPAS
ncbi:MAG: Mth938-like domain-containing protein [Burkholderiaceae bacterium]